MTNSPAFRANPRAVFIASGDTSTPSTSKPSVARWNLKDKYMELNQFCKDGQNRNKVKLYKKLSEGHSLQVNVGQTDKYQINPYSVCSLNF